MTNVRVVLNPVMMHGHVGKLQVSLTGLGGGAPPPSGTSAQLTFFEMPGRGDAAHAPRLILTVDGQLEVQGEQIRFAAAANDAARWEPIVAHTDWKLALEFDPATFTDRMAIVPDLYLPWEAESEGPGRLGANTTLEVGAGIRVGEEDHPPDRNHSAGIPLEHEDVLEDGERTSPPSPGVAPPERMNHYGVGTVYPARNFLLSGAQRIPIGRDPLKIRLHQSVVDKCQGANAGSFDEGLLRTKLSEIFNAAGFQSVDVAVASEEETAAHWRPGRNSRHISTGVTPADERDLPAIYEDSGEDMRFFDFWVFCERVAQHAEAGVSEMLNPSNPINVRGATKKIIYPIVLTARPSLSRGADGSFEGEYGHLSGPDNAMNFLANIVAHEVGHGFGLRHGVDFDPATGRYTLSESTAAIMTTDMRTGGSCRLARFNPVHADEIRRRFL